MLCGYVGASSAAVVRALSPPAVTGAVRPSGPSTCASPSSVFVAPSTTETVVPGGTGCAGFVVGVASAGVGDEVVVGPPVVRLPVVGLPVVGPPVVGPPVVGLGLGLGLGLGGAAAAGAAVRTVVAPTPARLRAASAQAVANVVPVLSRVFAFGVCPIAALSPSAGRNEGPRQPCQEQCVRRVLRSRGCPGFVQLRRPDQDNAKNLR
jgi:hypothetical protein